LDGHDQTNGKPKGGFLGFASLQAEDVGGGADEEEEDFGGLMVRSYCSVSDAFRLNDINLVFFITVRSESDNCKGQKGQE
jgi:hypothetical protein